MARLVMHVDAVDHGLGSLVALECLDRGFHVPLHDLAVEEQRGVGIALVVEAGVQRAETDFGFCDHCVARVGQFAVEPFQHQGMLDHRSGGRKLARADVILAVRADVHAVRVLRDRHVAGQRGFRILVGLPVVPSTTGTLELPMVVNLPALTASSMRATLKNRQASISADIMSS